MAIVADTDKLKDKFTTNFYLPDGSYGNIHDESYESALGIKVNMVNGAVEGSANNIYANAQSSKPSTASMDVPAQYTASGVGNAIPQSSVGNGLSVTITAATTVSAITIQATTVPATIIGGTAILEHTISGTTISARTISKSASSAATAASSASSAAAAPVAANAAHRIEMVSFIVMAPLMLASSFGIFL
jgi:hypothetical protein